MMTKDEKRMLYWEKNSILAWLKQNDYIVNKVFLGEWNNDDPRFIAYKNQRAIKRSRMDEIDSLIG